MGEYYAVVRSGQEDTLEHFGVLGMRWGVRHDRRVRMAKARFKTNKKAINKDKSLSKTQKARKIAASREEWMKERENAANRLYSLNSKAANRKLAREGTGKTLAKVALLGSAGAAQYNRSRAAGHGRLNAGVKGIAKYNLDRWALGIPSAGYYIKNRKARKKK